MELGSLFDGSGGFPLAGALCGITPAWASEVEPYPIAVTRSRFPEMKHLGDVGEINGAEIEPVDIITFGSPCQDLSVAGRRAGIHDGERSSLFFQAIRIIKEMRISTNGEYPRYAIWENVPGAFSSNRGEDFRAVLEAFIKVAEPQAVMPPVPKNGWSYADSFIGDGWSLAYRVLDAQYWGVPQRRRRIYLVADFRGERAAEILFEREGLQGHFEAGGTPWQGITADAQSGTGTDDRERGENCLTPWDVQSRRIFSVNGAWPALYSGEGGGHGYIAYPETQNIVAFAQNQRDEVRDLGDKTGALAAEPGMKQQTFIVQCHDTIGNGTCNADVREENEIGIIAIATQQGGAEISKNGKCPTITAAAGMSGNNQPWVCYEARDNGDGKTAATITGDHENRVTDYSNVVCLQGNGIDRAETAGCNGKGWKEDVSYTLNTIDRPAVAYAMQGFGDYKESDQASGLKARDFKDATDLVCETAGVDCRNLTESPELYPTLQAKPNGGQSLNFSGAVRTRYIVRRLTPTECARLQGFPDGWGQPDRKETLTDDEYRFWLDVRNTHAAANGKPTKDYTRDQILRWYNSLHTDSAEYKMWGNGIALPTALYVMQGIAGIKEIKG